MARERLGVALLVPEPAATEIDGLRRALGDGALERIRPHVTLVPPLNVRDPDTALSTVREAAAAARPLRLGLGPPGTFLPDSPVIHLPVSGDLEGLAALRDHVMRPPLVRPLSWPFVAHVTLLDEADPADIPSALEHLAHYRIEVVVDHVHVLREGAGRRWAPIAGFALAAPSVVGRGGLPVELTTSEAPEVTVAAWARAAWEAFEEDAFGEGAGASLALTARREGRVAGLVEGRLHAGTCELSRLIVGADERGQGVGSALLAGVEAAARARGCSSCRMRVPADGRAEEFLGHRGWRRAVLLEAWRAGRDLAVMVREL